MVSVTSCEDHLHSLPLIPTIPFEVWWLMSAIPALRRLRQGDCYEFQASLGYKVRPCLRSHKPKLNIKPKILQGSKQTSKEA